MSTHDETIKIRPLGNCQRRSCTITCPPDVRQTVAEICRKWGFSVREWGVSLVVSASAQSVRDALARYGVRTTIAESFTMSRDVAA